jgi:uncharacterized protein (DUF362 family)
MAITYRELHGYTRDGVKAALGSMLEGAGGLEALLGDRQSIVIKPNFLVVEPPEGGACTHPHVYMAVAELLLESGRSVTIGESPAFGSTQGAVRAHGVAEECADRGIRVLTFSAAEEIDGVADGGRFERLTIARELRQFDGMINLPKLKVHQQMMFTAAVKNLYGCVTGKRKAYRHFVSENNPELFGRMLLANAEAASALLHIGDGIEAMHRKGPRGGAMYPLGRLVLSTDYLQHDWLFCRMIGMDPRSTPLFQAAGEQACSKAEAVADELAAELPFEPKTDFEPSFESPISFTSWRMLRSIYKSWRMRLSGA